MKENIFILIFGVNLFWMKREKGKRLNWNIFYSLKMRIMKNLRGIISILIQRRNDKLKSI